MGNKEPSRATSVAHLPHRPNRTDKDMIMRPILVIAAVVLFPYAPTSATELVSNGSFETGTFSGWTATIVGSPFIPWLISPAGAGSGFSMATTQPQDGVRDAWNGFDGTAGTVFTVYQDITIPQFLAAPAILDWHERLQWNFALTGTATQPRTYEVQLRDTSNAVLATLYSFSTGTAHVLGDSGWQSHSVDVSTYAGSTIRLFYGESIPETFTGPGQFELDAVSLDVADFVSVDDCNTGVLNRAIDSSTLQQVVTALVDTCTASAHDHGGVMSCVTQGLNTMKKHGVITGTERTQRRRECLASKGKETGDEDHRRERDDVQLAERPLAYRHRELRRNQTPGHRHGAYRRGC